jgi:NAD(P)-dependent dehydrogenase (short-subunit alcohol dehydrogenase family)
MTRSKPQFALVTGGAKRLGRSIALELARAGWSIVLHCRHSLTEAQETAEKIKSLGVQCVLVQADLANPHEVDVLFDQAIQAGPIRCVINNASLFEFDSGETFQSDLFHRHMASNLSAPIQLTKRLFQHVPDSQQAVVVNLLDQKLKNLNPDFLSYTLTKAGLETATTLLAMELAPKIRVVGVAPGLTLISHLQTEVQFEKTHRISPLNQSSQPQDIANTVLFLVQNHAITGTTILVDGGQHLVPMARDFSMITP